MEADMNTQDYFETDEEREEGHVDTRSANFECEALMNTSGAIWK